MELNTIKIDAEQALQQLEHSLKDHHNQYYEQDEEEQLEEG